MPRSVLTLGCVLSVLAAGASASADPVIVAGAGAPALEQHAARELQRYVYQLTGRHPAIVPDSSYKGGPAFFVGRPESHRGIAALADDGLLAVSPADPGPEGYVLKTVSLDGSPVLVVAGSDEAGTLYGIYGLLDDHYDAGFYLGGDVLPRGESSLDIPQLDERNAPAAAIRGFLPWTNFPQSATVYSWEDWQFIIDQAARMRMNFILIHSYSGEAGHNENFANFELDGRMARVWMGTARAGHGWAGPAWDPAEYRFGAADLFGDYDFGAESALHNENLDNHQTFRKGASMFRRVIAYAHTRSVKIGLGLDINMIPPDYDLPADDPRVIAARADQIAIDYPDLDYLVCFRSEMLGHDASLQGVWDRVFEGLYTTLRERSPNTRFAVSGWGLQPDFVNHLPPDVVCAPISAYSDGFEDGSAYGDREYWGCPWLERDFNSSQYYYPYNMHLSNTIKAWEERAPNMTGFYTLTWRLTDAVDAKMSYVAKAPWDRVGRYDASHAVYHEYARRNYGDAAADAITNIINENEPFASGFGECQFTEPFTGSARRAGGGFLLNIHRFSFAGDGGSTSETAAADYNANEGTQTADSTEGSPCAGFISHGHWLGFENFDFGQNATEFSAVVASDTGGGDIKLRLDNPADGPVIGMLTVPNTGGWQTWQTLSAPIEPTSGRHSLYLVFLAPENDERDQAREQLALVADVIGQTADPEHRARLAMLQCRLGAAYDHMVLNLEYPHYTWDQLPGPYPSWVRNFTHRVNDISSLGNVQSHQNRFVNLNYFEHKNALRAQQAVKAPVHVEARGTASGAAITWAYDQPNLRGFHIYRDETRLTEAPLPPTVFQFEDTFDGAAVYRVSAVDLRDRESPKSVPYVCEAGSADQTPPHITVVSPPVTGHEGRPAGVTARILDNRAHDLIAATLHYRAPGATEWTNLPMARRVWAVFAAEIPGRDIGPAGVAYYVSATDGANHAFHPPAGPDGPLMLTAIPETPGTVPRAPAGLTVTSVATGHTLEWDPQQDVHWFRIYRGTEPGFEAGPATRLTYVAGDTLRYQDNGFEFDGSPLVGDRWYRVTAVDFEGKESAPTKSTRITYK